jgi:uncharacterized protein YbjT (DUF2867 family)
MRILVTGASGFLGGSVVPDLVGRGHEVVGLCRGATAATAVTGLGAEVLWGDLDDPAGIDAAFSSSGSDALVNLASLGFGHASTVVNAAKEAGIERAVFVSTTAIFTSLPAASRAVRIAAEAAIQASGLRWTIVRPTMIYGRPGDGNMARLLAFVRRSPVVPIPRGGRRLIQPVHVDDLAGFIATVLEADAAVGRAYDVAGPEPLTLRQIVETSGQAAGRRPRLVSLPLGPAIAAVKMYERLSKKPRLNVEQVLRLNEDETFDIGAAASLGFAPRSFAEGIEAEVALLR